MKKFPKNFIFSTSTAAFQIEGGRLEGGRKHSNWDKFTIDNHYIPPVGSSEREIASIENAADYYHKYKLDSKIMKEMGVNGFAYNLDWARIFPDDTGIPNEAGLNFYENAFKSLVENGIKPIPILYHWDTPLWLEEKGGTSSRVFLKAFKEFSKAMFERLGKYTNIWYVSDENSTYTIRGYLGNHMAPAKNDEKEFW
ncbi:MAG: family 1 glycosylhydrolase, partial [Metamycoplasmataceae bacterium]